LIYGFEGSSLGSVKESLHMGGWHDFIIETDYEKHGYFNIGDSFERGPKYSLNKALEVTQQREYVVHHFGN